MSLQIPNGTQFLTWHVMAGRAGQGGPWSKRSLDTVADMTPGVQAALANIHAHSLQVFMGGVVGEPAPAAPKQGARAALARLNAGNVGRNNQPLVTCDVCGGGPYKNLQIHLLKNADCKRMREDAAVAAGGGSGEQVGSDTEDDGVCTDPTHQYRQSKRRRCDCSSCVAHWEKVDNEEGGNAGCARFHLVDHAPACCCSPNSSQVMGRNHPNPWSSDDGGAHHDAKAMASSNLAPAAWETGTGSRREFPAKSGSLPESKMQCRVP